jgi:hypothetical protein
VNVYTLVLIENLAETLHHKVGADRNIVKQRAFIGRPLLKGVKMGHWEGHKTATSAALLDVITTAVTGSARPSHSDRILFTACEFWASARNCTLFEQLRDDPLNQLQTAEAAFTDIGLTGVALVVSRSREMFTEDPQLDSLSKVCKSIESSLAEIDEPVDQVIAAYANQQARRRQP